jgi:hypothetical protein
LELHAAFDRGCESKRGTSCSDVQDATAPASCGIEDAITSRAPRLERHVLAVRVRRGVRPSDGAAVESRGWR